MELVSENLYRGPRPKSYIDLKINGFTTCINLQSGTFEEFHDDNYERELAGDFGIEQVNIGCSDFVPPKEHEVFKFLKAVKSSKWRAYVHCKFGKDRTGFMVACWRMQIDGWSYEAAKREMFNHGFHKIPYVLFGWTKELKKYERKQA